ncbi:uncharacterized protein LOC135464372 [Liolophura sinensis]|uniref:uncharacterized protein LOC135464372 n=1 Tax=Liolophura sinensis TaxID=3198878 RepID=UPI0031591B75
MTSLEVTIIHFTLIHQVKLKLEKIVFLQFSLQDDQIFIVGVEEYRLSSLSVASTKPTKSQSNGSVVPTDPSTSQSIGFTEPPTSQSTGSTDPPTSPTTGSTDTPTSQSTGSTEPPTTVPLPVSTIQGIYTPDKVVYKLTMPLTVNQTYDEGKKEVYRSEFKRVLNTAYQNLTGFLSVQINDIREGSVICDHTVNFDTSDIQQGANNSVAAIATTIQREINQTVVPYLSQESIANGSVIIEKFDTALKTATSEAVRDPCKTVDLGCFRGYSCLSSRDGVVCQSDCKTEEAQAKCGMLEICALNDGRVTCVLERNKIIAICVGAGGGGVLVLVAIIVILTCKLRKSEGLKTSESGHNEDIPLKVLASENNDQMPDQGLRGLPYETDGRPSARPDHCERRYSYNNEGYFHENSPSGRQRVNSEIYVPSAHEPQHYEGVDEKTLAHNLLSIQPVGRFTIERPKLRL